jgi:hypothetical protein
LRSHVAEEAPQGYLTMHQAMRRLSRFLDRVKRGEIEATGRAGAVTSMISLID